MTSEAQDASLKLQAAWDIFMEVYKTESIILINEVRKKHPGGSWVVRIDDAHKTLFLQDLSFGTHYPNVEFGNL